MQPSKDELLAAFDATAATCCVLLALALHAKQHLAYKPLRLHWQANGAFQTHTYMLDEVTN